MDMKLAYEYQKRRDMHRDEFLNRRKRILEKFPRIMEIENEMAQISMSISGQILGSKTDEIKKLVDLAGEELNRLKMEKEAVLKSAGLSKADLEMRYSCNRCKDTGYVESGQKCSCLKQAIIDEAYNLSNMKNLMKRDNFESFNLDIFSNELWKDEVIPRENMEKNMEYIYSFIDEFENPNELNLLFYGSTGTGKTFLSSCIGKKLIDSGYTVIYQSIFGLMAALESYKFGKPEDKNKEEFKRLFDADLLIIDDLGTEIVNSWTISEVFNIINTRIISGKKMVISTNLSIKDIGGIYTDRIMSRLYDSFVLLKFTGPDLRWE